MKHAIRITGGYTGAVFVLDRRFDTKAEAEKMVADLKLLNPSSVGNTREVIEVPK